MNAKTIFFKTFILFFLAMGLARAQFLDFSQPARATAMGGNLVALPEGPSAMSFNPAGLGLQDRYQASARYEDLFGGLENDDISTGNLSVEAPFGALGGFGVSWDHLGANQLEQDDFRLSWGRGINTGGLFNSMQVGFTASYLTQRYILSVPLLGVSPTNVSAGSVALGAGILITPWKDLTLGASADDLNQPNLGVVGTDRIPILARWGAAFQLFDHDPVRLTMTAGGSLINNQIDNQGGLEIYFADYGIRLRGGADQYQASVGFGYQWSDFLIDYAYSFSAFANQEVSGVGLPGSNLLELGLKWGGGPPVTDYDSYLAKAQAAEQAKNWGWAAWYYQEALAIKPKDPTAAEGRKRAMPLYNQQRAARFYADGQSAEKAKAMDDARFYYEMSVKLAPDQADYTAALARVKNTENLTTAQKFYQDGLAAQQKGALFEARSDLGMAAKLAPDQADYAKALDQINQLFIQRITELTSTERKIDEYVGRISRAISKGDKKSADRALQEALGKYPKEPALELIQKMMALWEKGGEKNPPNRAVQLLENEADLYLSKGRPDLAKASLTEALKAQPSNETVKDKLAQLDQVAPVVSAENGQKAEMLYEKGLQCYLAGDLDGAIAAWEEALKANPDHMKARNNLVRAKVEKESKTP